MADYTKYLHAHNSSGFTHVVAMGVNMYCITLPVKWLQYP